MGLMRRKAQIAKPGTLLVGFLCCTFGLGSWVAMTGLWVEIPILVQNLPEGPSLASNLSMALQAANIFCVVYGILWRIWPVRKTQDISIHAMMAIGCLSCLLLVFIWDISVPIGHSSYSLPLYILAFGLSIVDCTSSVAFLPYMARFESKFMTPFLAGEGFGGFIPSLGAIAQGIGEEACINQTTSVYDNSTGYNVTVTDWVPIKPQARFSANIFMVILLVVMLLSWAAFFLLNSLTIAKKHQVPDANFASELGSQHIPLAEPNGLRPVIITEGFPIDEVIVEFKPGKLNKATYWYFMCLQGWASIATFGIFPALQPYSCLPYGSGPFHLAVTLSALAYPLACLLALYIELRGVKAISSLSLLATIISLYILSTSLMNPLPPLVGTTSGRVILVLSWILFSGIFSYVKTMITVLMRDEGPTALLWVGAVTQIGGLLGALLMVALVNSTSMFNDQICFVP